MPPLRNRATIVVWWMAKRKKKVNPKKDGVERVHIEFDMDANPEDPTGEQLECH
jgi:hypothetical protein